MRPENQIFAIPEQNGHYWAKTKRTFEHCPVRASTSTTNVFAGSAKVCRKLVTPSLRDVQRSCGRVWVRFAHKHTLGSEYLRLTPMAGPGGLFGRIAQWLANEVIVKGLANNPAFQRFAVRSSQRATELTKSAAEAAKNVSESESVAQFRKVRASPRAQLKENTPCPIRRREHPSPSATNLSCRTGLTFMRFQESEQLRQQANDFASVLREEIQEAVRKAGEDGRSLRK